MKQSLTIYRVHLFVLQQGAPALVEMCQSGKGGTDVPVQLSIAADDVVFRGVLCYIYGGDIASRVFYTPMQEKSLNILTDLV